MATNLQYAPIDGDNKKIGVADMRRIYSKFADTYNKMLDCDIMYCPKCDQWKRNTGQHTGFYRDDRFKAGYFPICKECIQMIVEGRKRENDPPNETKERVMKVLELMDKPYYDDRYTDCVRGIEAQKNDPGNKKAYQSPFASYITQVQSLPQYRGKKWKDSKFGSYEQRPVEETFDENSEFFKLAKEHFGTEYSLPDLNFLEKEYSDWCERNECNTKAQEEVYKNIAFTQLELHKARLNGEPTDKLTATLQKLMETGNITPRQTKTDITNGIESFGQLIQKFEETRPIPDPDPDLADVDKIGKYISVFFLGHLAKMIGIKNKYSKMYDDYMRQYSAKRREFKGDEDSEDIFAKVFGGLTDE